LVRGSRKRFRLIADASLQMIEESFVKYLVSLGEVLVRFDEAGKSVNLLTRCYVSQNEESEKLVA
jgi:hypothetical protein